MTCEWCNEQRVRKVKSTVYWELPDGTRAIEVKATPGIKCDSCGIEYQEELTIQSLEDQLMLIDTMKIGKSTTYDFIMEQPRLLKQNYFRFE